MQTLKQISVLAMALITLFALAWASPDSNTYREVKGRVERFDSKGGIIVVNGQRLALARNVRYEYGRPVVGSYVELKLINQGGWLVYKLEVKPQSLGQTRYDDDD